ncbi:MAG: SIS domain-containing protein [Coprobacillus sp.]
MWDYIHEQSDVLTNILIQEKKTISLLTNEYLDKQEVVITASGSSLNAALIVKALLEKETSKRVTVESPFQLRNYSTLLQNNPQDKVLIVLSQTGKSIGTLECLQLAKDNHIPTLAITAYDDSPIATSAKLHINMLCGDEPVGPKTKGFTATVLTLHILLMKMLQVKNHDQTILEYRQSILELPSNIENAKSWCQKHNHWAKAQALSIVGFGVNHPTAREGALKVLETMQIPVMNFEMEEFMHGPHRTIVPQSYLILIDMNGIGHELMNNFINFSKSKTENCLVISTIDNDDENIIHIGDYPTIASWLNAVIPFQIMCTYFPEINGVNSSKPVYGDFATTVGTRIQ